MRLEDKGLALMKFIQVPVTAAVPETTVVSTRTTTTRKPVTTTTASSPDLDVILPAVLVPCFIILVALTIVLMLYVRRPNICFPKQTKMKNLAKKLNREVIDKDDIEADVYEF